MAAGEIFASAQPVEVDRRLIEDRDDVGEVVAQATLGKRKSEHPVSQTGDLWLLAAKRVSGSGHSSSDVLRAESPGSIGITLSPVTAARDA
jgi:hypothetical protein